jgi:DNA-binding NtrC family response regulator
MSLPPPPHFDVLVVDDDEAVRDLVVSYFDRLGMRVTGAHDGRAAIATLQRSNGRYGLVVTDLSLPGADGFAVLQAARQANASCYVVIITGYASLDSAIVAVRVGAYDYLTKPFSLGQLEVILKRIADRASLERENRELTHMSLPPSSPTLRPAPIAEVTVTHAHDYAALERRIDVLEQGLARVEARIGLTGLAPSARR